MVFSGGTLSVDGAHERFDRMLARAAELPFAKQPVIERSSGSNVGYCGVDRFEFEGELRLEFGYRLVVAARGRGYATEAGEAVLAIAGANFTGELIAMIDPRNAPSSNVITKLGFTWWKRAIVDGLRGRHLPPAGGVIGPGRVRRPAPAVRGSVRDPSGGAARPRRRRRS